MKTTNVLSKLLCFIVLFSFMSCEKTEFTPTESQNLTITERGGDGQGDYCFYGKWDGKIVTEAINTGFTVSFDNIFASDAGDWSFYNMDTGTELNSGDLDIFGYSGAQLWFSIEDNTGALYFLYGDRDPDDCGKLTGKVANKESVVIGSFRLTQN